MLLRLFYVKLAEQEMNGNCVLPGRLPPGKTARLTFGCGLTDPVLGDQPADERDEQDAEREAYRLKALFS